MLHFYQIPTKKVGIFFKMAFSLTCGDDMYEIISKNNDRNVLEFLNKV